MLLTSVYHQFSKALKNNWLPSVKSSSSVDLKRAKINDIKTWNSNNQLWKISNVVSKKKIYFNFFTGLSVFIHQRNYFTIFEEEHQVEIESGNSKAVFLLQFLWYFSNLTKLECILQVFSLIAANPFQICKKCICFSCLYLFPARKMVYSCLL